MHKQPSGLHLILKTQSSCAERMERGMYSDAILSMGFTDLLKGLEDAFKFLRW